MANPHHVLSSLCLFTFHIGNGFNYNLFSSFCLLHLQQNSELRIKNKKRQQIAKRGKMYKSMLKFLRIPPQNAEKCRENVPKTGGLKCAAAVFGDDFIQKRLYDSAVCEESL